MANCRRTPCRLLALLALVAVGGCSASGPEPPFETGVFSRRHTGQMIAAGISRHVAVWD